MKYTIVPVTRIWAVGICWTIIMITQLSCKKYLDKKPSQNLTVPSTLADLQAVLDNQNVNLQSSEYLELVSDNYYLTSLSWQGLIPDYRKTYIWDKDAKITQ